MRPAAAGAVLGPALAVGVPTAWQPTREPAAAPAGLALPALGLEAVVAVVAVAEQIR